MERKVFFATLLAVFIFLAAALSAETPVLFATGNVTLELPGNATEVRLFLNGAEGDVSFDPGSYVNMTAIINVTGKTIYLDVNMTGWVTQNNTTRIENTTYFSDAGVYNITAWFPGDVNYTASSVTYFVTISAPPVPPAPPPVVGPGVVGPPINITPPALPSEFRVDIIEDDQAEIIGTNLGPGNYFADLSNASELPLTGVGFTLREFVSGFRIIIENVSKPAEIPGIEEQYGLEMPYQYIKVTVIGVDPEGPFRTINMNFKVERDWIMVNRIDEGTIGLYRYQDGWRPLSTTRVGGDFEYSRFFAGDVRAFSSYFVVSGKQLITLPPLLVPSYMVAPLTYIQLAILLFAILLLLILIRKRRKPLVIEEEGGW